MSEESKNNKKSESSKGFVLPGDLLDSKVNQEREFLEKMDEFIHQL